MSYLDYDLGYDSGYDTPQQSTRRTSRNPHRFAPEGSEVSYAMNGPNGVGSTSDHSAAVDIAARIYQQVTEQVENGETPTPDIAGAAGDLSQVEQNQRNDGATLPGDPDMSFSVEEARNQGQHDAINNLTAEEGVLAEQMDFNPGERAMFRQVYQGMNREDLNGLVELQNGEDPAERPGRIRQQMVRDYVSSLVPQVMGRYEEGTITEAQARHIAAEAVRRQGSLNDFERPAAGEPPNAENSTDYRIRQEIRSIPQGSTEVNQPIYNDAVENQRTEFNEQAGGILREIDSRYYGNRRHGDERVATDVDRFLVHRGIQDDPQAMRNLIQNPDGLRTQLTRFSQQVRGSETFANSIDQRRPDSVDSSGWNRNQRFQDAQRRLTEESTRQREQESFERQTAVQDRQRREDRAHQFGMQMANAAYNHELTMEQNREQSKMQLLNQMIGGSIQGLQQAMTQSLGQIQQMGMANAQAIFQGTNQMIGRAVDPGQWYGNASGQGSAPRSA